VSEAPVTRFIPTEILLPVDFSLSSRAALNTGVDLALHFHSTIVLVNVVASFSIFTLTYSVPDVALEQKMKAHAEQLLTKCCAALTAKGVTSRYSISIVDDTAEAIVEMVDREHIDLLVISTHGISGWRPVVFGSVAEKVVKLAQCPLLLLRSPQPETNASHSTVQSTEWW
jgi:nucleotide-binding universal stress UspA family protein